MYVYSSECRPLLVSIKDLKRLNQGETVYSSKVPMKWREAHTNFQMFSAEYSFYGICLLLRWSIWTIKFRGNGGSIFEDRSSSRLRNSSMIDQANEVCRLPHHGRNRQGNRYLWSNICFWYCQERTSTLLFPTPGVKVHPLCRPSFLL